MFAGGGGCGLGGGDVCAVALRERGAMFGDEEGGAVVDGWELGLSVGG